MSSSYTGTICQGGDDNSLPRRKIVMHSFRRHNEAARPPVREVSIILSDDESLVQQNNQKNPIVFNIQNRGASCKAPLLNVALVVLGLMLITFSRYQLQSVDDEVSRLLSIREESGKQVQGFENHIHTLRHELSGLDIMSQSKNPSRRNDAVTDPNEEEVDSLHQKVATLSARAENLRKQIQEESRREVGETYGSGVHRVEIQLAFPDNKIGPDTFVIELAPMDLMPHSVHFFLKMVSTGLLDGCSFILNALHVLKAAPLPFDGSSTAAKAKAFAKHGLESVAFREYSEHFPHKQYTVGFAADGSPSFYINTEDNSDHNVGDPCFGRIVSGFDAIKRLEQSPTRHDIWFQRRIGIKHATIVSNHENQ